MIAKNTAQQMEMMTVNRRARRSRSAAALSRSMTARRCSANSGELRKASCLRSELARASAIGSFMMFPFHHLPQGEAGMVESRFYGAAWAIQNGREFVGGEGAQIMEHENLPL